MTSRFYFPELQQDLNYVQREIGVEVLTYVFNDIYTKDRRNLYAYPERSFRRTGHIHESLTLTQVLYIGLSDHYAVPWDRK